MAVDLETFVTHNGNAVASLVNDLSLQLPVQVGKNIPAGRNNHNPGVARCLDSVTLLLRLEDGGDEKLEAMCSMQLHTALDLPKIGRSDPRPKALLQHLLPFCNSLFPIFLRSLRMVAIHLYSSGTRITFLVHGTEIRQFCFFTGFRRLGWGKYSPGRVDWVAGSDFGRVEFHGLMMACVRVDLT